jgi:hypothetical protein
LTSTSSGRVLFFNEYLKFLPKGFHLPDTILPAAPFAFSANNLALILNSGILTPADLIPSKALS